MRSNLGSFSDRKSCESCTPGNFEVRAGCVMDNCRDR